MLYIASIRTSQNGPAMVRMRYMGDESAEAEVEMEPHAATAIMVHMRSTPRECIEAARSGGLARYTENTCPCADCQARLAADHNG